jgi:hypothetical protein
MKGSCEYSSPAFALERRNINLGIHTPCVLSSIAVLFYAPVPYRNLSIVLYVLFCVPLFVLVWVAM